MLNTREWVHLGPVNVTVVHAEAMKQDLMATSSPSTPPNDSVKWRVDTAVSTASNYVSSSLELHENGMYLSHYVFTLDCKWAANSVFSFCFTH